MSYSNDLNTPIDYLKGVGPQRAEILKKELSIFTVWDLLNYFPFRYVDRSSFHKIAEISQSTTHIQIVGVLGPLETHGTQRATRISAKFYDETGTIDLVWFKALTWIKKSLKPGETYILFGKPSFYKGIASVVHPELELPETKTIDLKAGLQAVYNSTEKLTAFKLHSKGIEKIQTAAVEFGLKSINEVLPLWVLQKHQLMPRDLAYKQIHLPKNNDLLAKARFRLKFEELFFLQMQLINMKVLRAHKFKGFVFNQVGYYFNEFYNEHLPFDLTNAQKRVIKEIRKDLGSGEQMNRLLQGDVGAGKTIVALMIMLLALDNGFQATIMAPTEILATQHFQSIHNLIEPLGINCKLLTGSTKKAERAIIHEELLHKKLDILVGTHALLEDVVQFNNLGLVVIDEQHRFGVAQRAKLWRKNTNPPHVLVMTATPIPRTLAMTFYGDLEVSAIDELPPGRKPIQTIHAFDSKRLKIFGLIREELQKGRQAYIVYPLIEESETLEYKDLMDGYESVSRAFPEYRISIVHGRMKPEDKDFEMNRFVKGETHIMVATTVIEVGVNVPNASVMLIESAERFGLSQLHQLRGRVGRGAEQSYCILLTGNKLSAESKTRMETMVRTTNGFEIAEVDLQLRGPGDIMGTQQSGALNLNIANLTEDSGILTLARDAAKLLLNADPNLQAPEHATTAREFSRLKKTKIGWGVIS